MSDPFGLERFLEAQESAFGQALAELKNGAKETHWMWFVFPQMQGLGLSRISHKYGITSQAEAEAYLSHPVLGRRLIECTGLVNEIGGRSIRAIFGGLDVLKFRSSMTLFSVVAGPGSVFEKALSKYFDGIPDRRTLDLLGSTVRWVHGDGSVVGSGGVGE